MGPPERFRQGLDGPLPREIVGRHGQQLRSWPEGLPDPEDPRVHMGPILAVVQPATVPGEVRRLMEEAQRSEIAKRFPRQYMLKRILSLDIPDIYYYNQPELIGILNSKMDELVRQLIK